MKVKLRTLYSGPAGCFHAGQVVNVAEAEARALVSGGYASEVLPPSQKAAVVTEEKAVVSAPQTAAHGRGKRRY